MPISYSTTVKNNRLTQVITALDAGAGNAVLVIGNSSLAGATGVLATITLNKPSFTVGTPGAGQMSIAGVPLSNTNAVAGSGAGGAAKAELRDSTGTVIATGLTVTVSGGGGDIILNSVNISAGQQVTANSGVITHG